MTDDLPITYSIEPDLTAEEFVNLLVRSTLAERRPVDNHRQILGMLRGASVIATARLGKLLVGVSRAISDGHYCTYLSDLAVDEAYQRRGIGRRLINATQAAAGDDCSLILLAAPKARAYYPHIGMQQHDSCWILPSGRRVDDESAHTHSLHVQTPLTKADSSGVADFFNAIAGDYQAAIQRCVPRYEEMQQSLLDYIPLPNQGVGDILELGCGTGNLSVEVAAQFPEARLSLVDLSDESLQCCATRLSRHSRLKLHHSDMRQLDFQESGFDLILSSIAIHHLSSSEKRQLFSECFNWLRPGGVLTFCDQFSACDVSVYRKHMESWRQFAIGAGTTMDEWNVWMRHQDKHDHHDSLPDQMDWLRAAGFVNVDCPWRHLLWSVVQARKPS